MKSYKMVNSQSVKKKADRLNPNMSYIEGWYDRHPFMVIENDNCYTVDTHYAYNNIDVQEITQKDFLALPEPIKIGDWYKIDLDGDLFFAQVDHLDGDEVEFKGISDPYNIGILEITKLNDEQIKILDLDN